MTKEKAEKIIRIYNWVRFILLAALLTFLFVGLANAQDADMQTPPIDVEPSEREAKVPELEKRLMALEEKRKYMPKVHGILRGKCEYQPSMDAARFEVRNARLSVSGELPLKSEYKLEVDLCDETSVKMKDAWVGLNPWQTLQLTVGQQRMPFSIDAHRNPSAQYFANRSFIAKQVGDMRDVGFLARYHIINKVERKVIAAEAGIFNGSNLDEQKSAWFKSPGYSARIQIFPLKGLAIIPSVQHQAIAQREASYTSLDLGAYYETKGWHLEAEYLHKSYADGAFSDCNAVDAMVIYQHLVKKTQSYIDRISYQIRYDYMQDHTSGQGGFTTDAAGEPTNLLALTDAERHRMTLGATFSVRNPYFPTDIRFNYEKYWYPHGGAKESEQDKLVCELVIKF